jgi:pyrroloquinoline quinone biosynthesis protein B
MRQQIMETPSMQPRDRLRDSPIKAIVLTNADVDHIAGLLTLRERWPLRLFATRDILSRLAENPIFNVLAQDLVERIEIGLDEAFEPIPGVVLTLFAAPGKVPLWGETGMFRTDEEDGRTVGVAISAASADSGPSSAFYVPGCATLTSSLADRLRDAKLVLFDGTLFTDDEMIQAGIGTKTGRRMGHMPVSGPGGSLEAFAKLGVKRKIYIHINNSNPLLIEGSVEQLAAASHGWDIAADGMEISL